jgi:peroxiredoxin (alkyl hydroperoxide reductase subunit C)
VAVLEPGTPAPPFSLRRHGGDRFTQADLTGRTTVLVFFPYAFSPVCTDQLSIYNEVLDEFRAQGATLYGVSCDAPDSQEAFRRSLGVEIEMLSDWEPKGEACRAFGVYHPAGMPTRALVITGPDGVVRWSWEGEHPGVLPGANLIFDGLAAV